MERRDILYDVVTDELRHRDGTILTGVIPVNWYGEDIMVDELWLKNMKRFKIVSSEEYIDKMLKNVRFIKHNRNTSSTGVEAYSIYLTEPIYVEKFKEFRVIARYPKYAISEDGSVLKISTGRVRRIEDILKHYEKYTKHNSYPILYIYDPRLGYSVKSNLHVLLATTWIENKDWSRYIVNHINHNKLDLSLDNLEWVSSSENTQLYYENSRANT